MNPDVASILPCVLEGVSFGLKDSFTLIQNAGLGEIKQVRASGGGTSDVPRSSQAYPTGSTATPSGHSPGQGSGTLGTATADFHTFDTNRDGNISREDGAQKMRGTGSAGSGSSAPR